jgi:hypothetical protein
MLVLRTISGPDAGDVSSVPSRLDFDVASSVRLMPWANGGRGISVPSGNLCQPASGIPFGAFFTADG